MKAKKNILDSESSICSIIVSYYRHYLGVLKKQKGFSHFAPRVFVPSLFIWGHISLSNLLQTIGEVFKSAGFISTFIDTHMLGSSAEEIFDFISSAFILSAKSNKALRWPILVYKIKRFFARNAGRLIFLGVMLILIIDIIYVDMTDKNALMGLLKRGSIFIIILGLFIRIFGAQFALFVRRVFGESKTVTIFDSPSWHKLIRRASLELRPFVIVFTQLNVLSGEQIHKVLKIVSSLQRYGIVCIAIGKKDLITSIVKSSEKEIKEAYFSETYAGVDFGWMQFETVFTLSMYVNKRSIEHIGQAYMAGTHTYQDPQLSFVSDEVLTPIFEVTVDPFITLLHMSEANISGIVESIRLYAAILGLKTQLELTALTVFIIANRYDVQWLDRSCLKILKPDSKLSQEQETDKHLFDKFPRLVVICFDALKKKKALIPDFYNTFGRVLPE